MKKTKKNPPKKSNKLGKLAFIDLFAGCGGLSLGLLNSGWKGLFAIEKDPDAFKTLQHNLIDKKNHNQDKPRINWVKWLEKNPHDIHDFTRDYKNHLHKIRGKVPLIVGGPPCQGFSFAGRRYRKDSRNELFKLHLEVVDLIKPKIVLLENVRGISVAFKSKSAGKRKQHRRPYKSYSDRIRDKLNKHGYIVQEGLIKSVDFGVPQLRARYFIIGIRKDLFTIDNVPNFFEILYGKRNNFLRTLGLPIKKPITASDAISDMETTGKKITACDDIESPHGFKEIKYTGPISKYQKLMHKGMNGNSPNSLRLVNHRPETIRRFKKILNTCRQGVHLSKTDRARLGIKKTAITPLSGNLPSHTITTLPDDLLHYAEPRVHTVREYARFQSFPDWFEFRGKYTTGGDRRTKECPRYSQVGNAVPPLLAEAIGHALRDLLSSSHAN